MPPGTSDACVEANTLGTISGLALVSGYKHHGPPWVEVHGNPNVLTLDKGTSKLAQGPSAMTALVEVECYTGELPPVKVFMPPEVIPE